MIPSVHAHPALLGQLADLSRRDGTAVRPFLFLFSFFLFFIFFFFFFEGEELLGLFFVLFFVVVLLVFFFEN